MRIFAAVLAVIALCGSGAAAADNTSTLDKVLDRGHVRICTTGDYKPFTYKGEDSEEYEGLDIRMGQDLAAALDVDAKFVATTWSDLIDDMEAGKCDISMGGISIKLERQARAYFSDPYLVTGKAPITRCENTDQYETIDQINDPSVTITANPGGTNEEFAREQLGDAELVMHDDNRTIFDKIIDGSADVMVTDAVETVLQANKNPELCAVNPDEPFTYSPMGYLLPRGDEVWRQWVNQWLTLTKESGEFDEMYESAMN